MTLAFEQPQTEAPPRGRSKAKLWTSLAIIGVGLVGAFGAAEECDGLVFFDKGERFCLGDVQRDRAQVIGFSMLAAAGGALAVLWK